MTDFYTLGYTKTTGGVRQPVEILVTGATDAIGVKPVSLTQVTTYEEAEADRRFVFTLDACPLTIVDSGANGGQGSILLHTFPAGLTRVLGTRVKLTITGGTGITATADFVCSVGTTAAAADNATLETTEVTFLASTACSLVGSTKTFTASSTAVIAFQDGRTTPTPVYLNFAVDTTGISANAVLTITGNVWMSALII